MWVAVFLKLAHKPTNSAGRHFCLLLEYFNCVFIWKFEHWSTKWRCEKPTQYQQPQWSRGSRLFAFGVQTTAETVEDSFRAEEPWSRLGSCSLSRGLSLKFLSVCGYGCYWKSSFVWPVVLGIPVSQYLRVSFASPELIPFPESLFCIGLLASFFLSSFCAQSSLSLRDLNSSQLLEIEPLGCQSSHS